MFSNIFIPKKGVKFITLINNNNKIKIKMIYQCETNKRMQNIEKKLYQTHDNYNIMYV